MEKLAREDAWNLLTEYTETPALQQHALMVEAVMRHFARLAGEDEEVWGVAGLLHDLDYEKYPEEHCKKATEIMEERGIDPVYIRAMNVTAMASALIRSRKAPWKRPFIPSTN